MLQEWILQLIFKALPSVSCAFETLQGAEKSLHQVSPVAVSVVSHSHSCLLQTIACFPPMIDLWSSTGSGYLGTCSFMRWNSSYSTRCCKNHSWRLLKLVRNSSSDDRFMEFNGQWVCENVLLYEMKAFSPDFGCCKNESSNWYSKPSPQSRVPLKHSKGQRSLFIKWAPWQFRWCHILTGFCFRLSHVFLRW